MGFCRLLIILILSLGVSRQVLADPPSAYQCRATMTLSAQEYLSYGQFNNKLKSKLTGRYGLAGFQQNLTDILEENWYEERVIDMSPVFMEKLLNLVDQHKLIDLIQTTVRADNYNWGKFKLHMELILQKQTYIKKNQMEVYRSHALALIEDIQKLPDYKIKSKTITGYDKGVMQARTIMAINNMNFAIERWNLINKEIQELRKKSRRKTVLLIGLTSVGVAASISALVYAGPVIAVASRFATSYASDAVVASYLTRAGRIIATSGVGGVFGASSKLAVDTGTIVSQATRNSNSANTDYLCELEKKIGQWKKKGISPYVKVALISGVVSVPAGELMLTKLGGRIIYGAIAGSATIQSLYSMNALSESALKALAEYRTANKLYDQAIKDQKNGDFAQAQINREFANIHLQKYRIYWGQSKKNAAESLLILIALKEIALHSEWEAGYSALKLVELEVPDEVTNSIDQFLSYSEQLPNPL